VRCDYRAVARPAFRSQNGRMKEIWKKYERIVHILLKFFHIGVLYVLTMARNAKWIFKNR
jgi:hypothetical protein